MYIDSHTHFDIILEDKNRDESELFSEMKQNNIVNAVQVSIDIKSLHWSYDFALRYRDSGILFTAGIHPSSKAEKGDLKALSGFIKDIMESENSNLLFGIGECGLDFYRMRRPVEMQKESFQYQLNEAKRWSKPVIIHSRDAMDETAGIIKNNLPLTGVMHCFPGNKKAAKKILDLGLYISFAGNVTYKNAVELHESAQYVPNDRLLIETDAPFLTPVPLRGKKNRPEYIINTYSFLAELRKEKLFKVVDIVRENFEILRKREE